MTKTNEHEIERRLAEDRAGEPPADLAARIRAEIPEELPSFTVAPDNVTPLRPRLGRRLLLAAAGTVLVAGSGAIAWRVLQQGAQHGPVAIPAAAKAADGTRAGEKGKGEAATGQADQAAVRDDAATPASPAPAESASEPQAGASRHTPSGVVVVTVFDAQGASLPGAEVSLARSDALETAVRRTRTDAAGRALFERLPEGTYSVLVQAVGLEQATVASVGVAAGATVSVPVTLQAPSPAVPVVVAETGRRAQRRAEATPGVVPDDAIFGVPEALPERERPQAAGTAQRSDQAAPAAPQVRGAAEEQRRVEELKKLQSRYQRMTGIDAKAGSGAARDESGALSMALAAAPAAVPPSTGGTAEPNDRPYGDVFFQHSGVNPFIDTEDDALSTFGLDVDTGSYTVARRYLADGNLPEEASVRVEEWVNYFHYGDRPPRRGDFAVTAEAAPTPFGESDRHRIVRFGIRARDIDDSRRKPAVLTFVVDVSGSMSREDRLGLVKRALFALLDRLAPSDEVALVVYGSRGQVLLEPTADKEKVRSAIDRLNPGGSTNAEEGLVLAYDLAGEAFRRGAINRVILCSDGVANVGRTGPESILARIEKEASRGIELTTVGFGMGNYNDVLMEQLADRGNGRYAYVDTFKEARRIFVENLTGTLQTIAVNAKVQVEFNPKVVSRYRLLGYENRDIADDRFRDDTVDAGEIGAGHTVTALYEVKLQERPARDEPLATLHLRYRPEAGREFVETVHQLTPRDVASSWEQASPSLKLAAAVAETAEILKGSYWAKDGDLNDVFRRAQQLSAAFPGDVDVAEFVALVGSAARLKAPAATPATGPEEEQ